MTPHKFLDFILKRVLVTYLTLIPSFFLVVISLSLLSVGIFVIQVVLVLTGTFIMYRKYEKEKAQVEEEKFIKKLRVLFEEFEDKVSHAGYGYSLLNAALRIAENDAIQKRTKAWSVYLRSILDNIHSKSKLLDEKLKKETKFSTVFNDFQSLLFFLRDFRTAFYDMVKETMQDKNFSQDADFQKVYRRLYEEYNNYMDRLVSFSDELKAQFNLRLAKDFIEHLKDLNELYKQ
jgi:hypothetical protein